MAAARFTPLQRRRPAATASASRSGGTQAPDYAYHVYYLCAMVTQSSRKAEALVVIRTRSNAIRRNRFS